MELSRRDFMVGCAAWIVRGDDAHRLLHGTILRVTRRLGDGLEHARFLLAVAMHESAAKSRRQHGGPARGLWQFEYVAMKEVWRVPASRRILEFFGMPEPSTAWRMLLHDDFVACVHARALYEPHGRPHDVRTDERLYLKAWKPGRHDRIRWWCRWHQADLFFG